MRNDGPHIEILSKVETAADGKYDIMGSYDTDKGVLAMPDKFTQKLGQRADDDGRILDYSDLVSMYDEWLEDQLKAGNQKVMAALDEIFNKAINTGVVLHTFRSDRIGTSHAHIIKRVIMELASG